MGSRREYGSGESREDMERDLRKKKKLVTILMLSVTIKVVQLFPYCQKF